MSRELVAIGLTSVLCTACVPGPKVVSTRSLLAEMTDLAGMAEFPDPPYTCKQLSSYDRASTSPSDAKTWFANADTGQFIRSEQTDGRTEYVMMDAAGPGAIVRIWSANPMGTLRVYLDENPIPVIEAPMADFLGGSIPGNPRPIAGERSRGWNSYLPIPYALHCKVTSDERRFYYHINYRTYPPGTAVETFAMPQLGKSAGPIRTVSHRLRTLDAPSRLLPLAGRVRTGRHSLAAGERRPVAEFRSSAAISEIVARVEAANEKGALRQTLLYITFDGETTVACPLGDFFGGGIGVNAYESLPMAVRADGELRCHWLMPFQREATMELQNCGTQPVSINFRVDVSRYRWTDRSMHFHAKWRGEYDVPTRPMVDWNYLTVSGKGVFAGAAFAVVNPVKHWWGEGDEKMYVDGETFPSHFGTGTEDYFGYAWCCPDTFEHAYHNQPRCDGPGNYGHTAVNRWHIMDRIPFNKSFQFDMELWHWNETAKVSPSVVAYWYARPGAGDGFAPIQPADLRVVDLPPYVPPRVTGAIEGEQMRIVSKTATADPQAIDGCSNDHHLWWRGGQQPGDRLVLAFDAPAGGRYRVVGRFLKAIDYGVVQLSVNDQPAGQPIDFFNDGVLVTEEMDLGTFDLTTGENRISAEVIGANDRAIKQYMFGLDYLRLEAAP